VVELGSQAHAANPLAIFTSPREAFIGVRARPRPVIFTVIMCVFALLPAIGFVANVDARQMIEKQLKTSGQWDQLPDDAREKALEFGPKMMKYGAPVGAILARLAWILVIGLLGWAMLKATSEELRYGACVAAVALACAPLIISDALTCAVYFMRDPRVLDPANPLLSNPAAWFSIDTQAGAFGAFLKRLDLFQLWNVVLTAVGLRVVSKRKSFMAWLAPGGVYLGLWITDVIGGIVAQTQAG
jgi:hypothetical protein